MNESKKKRMNKSDKRKTAAVFDPYLDTIGGGEVYTCSVIDCLLKQGFEVTLFWKDKAIKKTIKKYLGINIDQAIIDPKAHELFTKRGQWLQKRQLTHRYDVVFFLSDGSIPPLFSKNNILHFQIPFTNVHGTSLLNHIKLSYIHHIICNSFFTKRVIDKEYDVRSEVLYPPLNISPKKTKKQNIILSVGRFTETLHHKRQDVLISAFKEMIDAGLNGWKFHLVGSSKEGKSLIGKLQKEAHGYPITIMTDVTHDVLEREYGSAKIFWHAAGLGVDEKEHPERVEHFGIATAEAMSAGCVPIVINKGGQPEIVTDGESGLLWNTVEELKESSLRLIKQPILTDRLAQKAKHSCRNFSKEKFCEQLLKMLDNKDRKNL